MVCRRIKYKMSSFVHNNRPLGAVLFVCVKDIVHSQVFEIRYDKNPDPYFYLFFLQAYSVTVLRGSSSITCQFVVTLYLVGTLKEPFFFVFFWLKRYKGHVAISSPGSMQRTASALPKTNPLAHSSISVNFCISDLPLNLHFTVDLFRVVLPFYFR